jgi:hypothetical protein
MAPGIWQTYSGQELEDMFLRSEDLGTLLPRGSAVYVWRRHLTPPSEIAGNGALFARWMAEAVKVPSAKLPRQDLSHFLSVDGVSLGGNPLTDDKVSTLREWLIDAQSRKWMAKFVGSVSDLAPPLYVGESDELPRRIKEHLNGDTDFSTTLLALGLKWTDCRLSVCPVPSEMLKVDAKARRTLIEMIVARLAIAGSTSRPG